MTDDDGLADTGSGSHDEPRGVDIARRALEEARANAAARGKSVGKGGASPRRKPGRTSSRRGWSSAGSDSRDPQPLGKLAASIAKQRGWTEHVKSGTVLGCWEEVVGAEIAEHAVPRSLDDKVLYVTAESTTWATQLRLMQSQILSKIARAVGHGVVTSLRIHGPTAPSWRHGPLHVSGRGPRDTYG